MAKLPVCSGKDAIRVFERLGWAVQRQKGSHVSMTRPGAGSILTIPLHRELGAGTLRALIRTAGITVDEFVKML